MKLYTAQEIARILRVHIKTVYKWGCEGKLERVKVGATVRYALPEKEGTK
jgi:excisionase family DNA binding protein